MFFWLTHTVVYEVIMVLRKKGPCLKVWEDSVFLNALKFLEN